MPGDDVCRVDYEGDFEVCDGDVDVDVALVYQYILLQPGDDVCRDYEACDGDDDVVNVDNYDDNDGVDVL